MNNKQSKLAPHVAKGLGMQNGFTECYPIEMLETLIEQVDMTHVES